MKSHNAYEKMPKSLKKLNLNDTQTAALDKLKWVVTEKIHGANFGFVYEQKRLKFAKRKEFLEWSDDFFGFQWVASRLESQLLALFERLSLDIPAAKYTIYGELFGGAYPHPAVAPQEGAQAIQTGTYYSPNIEFCGFDIAVEPADAPKYYIDYEAACAYFEKFGILYAKSLFTGTLNQALGFNIRFNSHIPSLLGLPDLGDNLVEGVVIKPLNNPAPELFEIRPIFKLKNREFEEDERFHEAEKWGFIPKVVAQSEEMGFWVEELNAYLNNARVESAISKIGRLDPQNAARMEALETEIWKDILEDFEQNTPDLLALLDNSQQQWLKDRTLANIRSFMRDNF
jgi:Rnl2 family RNA ligase